MPRGPRDPLRSRAVREAARTQLWPVPVLGVVLAVLAGILLPELDDALDGHLPAVVSDVVFGGGTDAARTVLDAIASSLITVTALTFSLTVQEKFDAVRETLLRSTTPTTRVGTA